MSRTVVLVRIQIRKTSIEQLPSPFYWLPQSESYCYVLCAFQESYLNEYDEYVEERQVTVHTSTMDYRVRRIILVFLMGICAIALFLCIQQARELKKAMEASARKGSYSTVITSKTPLLESLPHEGVQDGPVIAVATLK